jgi:phage terminase large subunit-like protein
MEAMGTPPLPWQRDALAVACEIDPVTGKYWYKTVIVIVLRRAGKTTISRGKVTHRALTTRDAYMVYTAQNRIKALGRLRKDFYTPLMRSPFASSLARPRWRGGEEALIWKTGSELAIDAVGRKAGHGDTLTEAHIDEAYVHGDSTLQDGVSPSLRTVRGSQLWILSAAGDTASTYLREKVELGRAIVQAGNDSRTCYIEYSADPSWDPDDPETVLNTHPAVGYHLDIQDIMADREGQSEESLRGWERAWIGWWPLAKAPEAVIPAEAWRACYAPEEDEQFWDGTPLWSVDVAPERDWTSIGFAGKSLDPEARCFLELVQREEGTEWAVPRLKRLAQEHGGWTVAVDAGGGAASLIPDLEDAGFEVVKMPAAQRSAASGGLYDDALAGRLRTLENTDVTEARKSAAKLRTGESWVFSRGKSMQDITALYALIVARWAWIENREADYDITQSFY